MENKVYATKEDIMLMFEDLLIWSVDGVRRINYVGDWS